MINFLYYSQKRQVVDINSHKKKLQNSKVSHSHKGISTEAAPIDS